MESYQTNFKAQTTRPFGQWGQTQHSWAADQNGASEAGRPCPCPTEGGCKRVAWGPRRPSLTRWGKLTETAMEP